MKLTQFSLFLGVFPMFFVFSPVLAVDHNNIDAGFPLSFDDADSFAFGEQSLDLGTVFVLPSDRTAGGELELEYSNGFALNSHFSISIDPQFGGRADSNETDFDIGNLSVGIFHNFNREYDNVPAFAIRGDAAFPTGLNSQGMEFRVRGIASKTIGQYDRLHLNLDLTVKTNPENGDRAVIPGIILGYSTPLGYPYRFDRTFLAELGVRVSENSDGGAIIRTGVGIRQQVGYQNVLSIGLEGDIATGSGERSEFRFITGYSFGF